MVGRDQINHRSIRPLLDLSITDRISSPHDTQRNDSLVLRTISITRKCIKCTSLSDILQK